MDVTQLTSPKVLPLKKAVELTVLAARRSGLSIGESKVLELLVASCQPVEQEGELYYKLPDLQGFMTNLGKAIQFKDSSWLTQKRGLCVDKVVDVEEFSESSEFMNQRGYIRPVIKYELLRLFESTQFVEAVLTGAIGIGKNYFADLALAYMLYLLSCYHNPQIEFDLAPGSSIVFIQQSQKLTLAKKVVFEQFTERLKHSPYFMKRFPFDPQIKSELRFPKNIQVLPVGGSDTSAIGMNVYGGIIDELNFMERVRDSIHTRYTSEEEYDQAQRLYSAIIRRMKSRFMQKGKLPGKLMLVSSTNYPGDFTDRKIEESQRDETIFVMKYSLWDALPADRFSGERFLIEVGNESKQSRILETKEQAREPEDVISVPLELKPEFERDIDEALRDLGGMATGTKRPFIPYKELIVKAQEAYVEFTGQRSLFLVEEVCLTDFFAGELDRPDWGRLVDEEYLKDVILDPTQAFAVHCDVGVTQDACGVGIGRIVGYKLLPSTRYFDERMQEFIEVRDIRAPIYMIDGVLRVISKPGEEVDLELVRDLVLWLRGYLNIRWATCDTYQSVMMIQAWRKARMRSGPLSVDETIAPYTEVKMATKDERLLIPMHTVLAKELREIEKDRKKDIVDHPPGGSKDCSDVVAGVVYMLQRKEARYGRSGRGRRGRQETQPTEKSVRKIRMAGGRRRLRVRTM